MENLFKTSTKINDLLENIGQILDITQAQHETVEKRYTAVANQLSQEGSLLSLYQPEILPQGSFLLGTMIRPIMEDDELDVDLVCRLKGKKSDWVQKNLKDAVRDQLLYNNEDYKRMLDEEGNRCWTLIYSCDKFHLDILPAMIGNNNHVNLDEKSFRNLSPSDLENISLRITDKREYNYTTETNPNYWLKSNPFGYAAWFKERSNINQLKRVLASESVTPLPGYKKSKEPLLRIIQILKRHRDIMFGGDEHKPISVIITTLAAKAYQKEANIIQGLVNILETMQLHMRRIYSEKHGREIWYIENPVNAEENFGDKWPGEPEKEDKFFEWLEKAKSDFRALTEMDPSQAYRLLKNILGTRPVNEAVRNLGYDELITENLKPANYSPQLLSVSHREQPRWRMSLSYNCEIYGRFKDITDYKKSKSITAQSVLPKGCEIYFTATTNVPKPYDVFWQVVNTGAEAENSYLGRRGGIFSAQTLGKGGLVQKEHSGYTGTHWIECFIVKDGVCVARSSEFFVNIR
ncbi:nucleotidyltransferase [Flavobacterium quisquiliarum]|uniref:Nucleotidyltransferase n=1 Tax=Flavobacterium quisquiliarum TaxID=1834436 RepID=A0ABV8W1X1_9FLAO|nr:nucleotidyltransferase [Flavobacterium quisquiliarum]MBW1655916.1 nucleotidyltransferase [Flavobacterium quisquiliarum]